MKTLWTRAGLLAVGLMMAPSWLPVATAAQGQAQGETSGPAAGSQTKPSAAVQKEVSGDASTAAGAPGKAGKQGAEAGSQPSTPASRGQSTNRQ